MDRNFYERIVFLQKFKQHKGILLSAAVKAVESMPIHMHDGVELLYVLRGKVKVKISFNHYELQEGDFLLINTLEVHALSKITDNLVLFLECPESIFGSCERFFAFDPDFYRRYNAEQVEGLKRILAEIYLEDGFRDQRKKQEDTAAEISRICIDYFEIQHFDLISKERSPLEESNVKLDRIGNTFRYFYLEFDGKIQLETVAEREYIDKYYASHLIKQGTGSSFQTMLNIVRIDRAEILLLGTKLPISEIVELLGFSSYPYFNRQFKTYFHMTPTVYRKAYSREVYPQKPMQFAELPEKEDVIKVRLAALLDLDGDSQENGGSYVAENEEKDRIISILSEYCQSENTEFNFLSQEILSKKIKRIIFEW